MSSQDTNAFPYKIPTNLDGFQKIMYIHLIEWKWKNITKKPGFHKHNGKDIPYDAILPISVRASFPLIYPPILNNFKQHLKEHPFKLHTHFNHMASSQAACINLFFPILLNPNVNEILQQIKPDFKKLATEYLYKGFQIEYWDGKDDEKGLLGDHNARSGTDSDIAIAYYNMEDELCLWLIEHKLTEVEFTECGGFKSKGRDTAKHLCESSFSDIIHDKNICYYHDVRKSNYWNITEENSSFFLNFDLFNECPFKTGVNQLWRNQILGLAIEKDEKQPYKKVSFSVVSHPFNFSLNNSIDEYKKLIHNNPKFFCFTTADVTDASAKIDDKEIKEWLVWYKEIYNV